SELPTLAAGELVLADIGRLQERQLELPERFPPLGRFRREGRNAAVRRIDDQRSSAPEVLVREKDRGVVGPAHVLLAAARVAPVGADDAGPLLVEHGAFLVGELRLVGVLGRTLQRRLVIVGPDALEIRIAPWRL